MRDQILITRPAPEAAGTAGALAARGLQAIATPFLVVAPLEAKLPDAVQAVLVTSANAIPALPRRLRETPLLAVGDATATRARAAGFCRVESAGGNARDLGGLAARRCNPKGGTLLVAAGRGHGAALAADLRGRGFTVTVRAVYASDPVSCFPDEAATALRQDRLRAALFYSAGTARAFAATLPAGLHPALAGVEALAIAPAAAAPLALLPWRAVRAALHPTQDELLALL